MGGSAGGGGGPGGIFNIGKSRATLFDKGTKVNITFSDVAGLDEAKVEVMEIVDFLKNPYQFFVLDQIKFFNIPCCQHLLPELEFGSFNCIGRHIEKISSN